MKYFLNVIFLLISLCLASCVETVIVAGATTGTVVVREKSAVDTKDDIVINTKIIKEFLENNIESDGNTFGVIVSEGRVLLTGVANNSKSAKKAADICWNVKGVKEVMDEIQLIPGRTRTDNFLAYFKDAMITTEVETRLIFQKNIDSINYKSTTVNGVVYLIGIGRDSFEIKKVTNYIARISGVKKVVSHVVLASDDRREK